MIFNNDIPYNITISSGSTKSSFYCNNLMLCLEDCPKTFHICVAPWQKGPQSKKIKWSLA